MLTQNHDREEPMDAVDADVARTAVTCNEGLMPEDMSLGDPGGPGKEHDDRLTAASPF